MVPRPYQSRRSSPWCHHSTDPVARITIRRWLVVHNPSKNHLQTSLRADNRDKRTSAELTHLAGTDSEGHDMLLPNFANDTALPTCLGSIKHPQMRSTNRWWTRDGCLAPTNIQKIKVV